MVLSQDASDKDDERDDDNDGVPDVQQVGSIFVCPVLCLA